MNFPELETSRLMLTQLSGDDSQGLLDIFSDKSVTKFYDIDSYDSLGCVDLCGLKFVQSRGNLIAARGL
ncbi:hypothetical protein [Pseudoalteromonas porphyrae]|uniref:Uncharacterized protein n=1 Tax=Pseudoalteromonas porphyrae TaxID=187330 RepID=A0A0N0M1U1_9GAMM|nr:hypothetical protein [Pseudoalteromonas porphyrae]KPH65019.1 hypothetical protein ADS77_04220 [Pseudoalteromonas porphyrae]